MSTRRLKPEDVQKDIEKQRRLLTGNASQKKFNSKVIGPTMVTMVIIRFLKGKGPDDKPWLSKAKITKLAGKYSKAYKKRPSGRMVSGGSIRNTDTGELANSHDTLSASAQGVKVGPKAALKNGKARKIMQREAGYGNYAVGWDAKSHRIVTAEIQAFMTDIANGKTPQYLPKSKVQVRI